jgi:hypothetical protein
MPSESTQVTRLTARFDRLANEIHRELTEVRRDLAEIAGNVADLSSALNANVRVQDRDALNAQGRYNDLKGAIEALGEKIEEIERAIGVDQQLADLPNHVAAQLLSKMSAQQLAEIVPRPTLDGARRIAYLGADPTGPFALPSRDASGAFAVGSAPHPMPTPPAPAATPVAPAAPDEGLVWNVGTKSIPVGKAALWLVKHALPAGAIGTAMHFVWKLIEAHVH